MIALSGDLGAGKTTLISIICGIVNASSGQVTAAGYDIVKDYRKARETIGLSLALRQLEKRLRKSQHR